MSERLVIEFYDSSPATIPVATILAFHGGEDPPSAALTIVDFLGRISELDDPRLADAGVLAARFIAWMGAQSKGPHGFEFSDVALIHHAKEYNYQTARVYAREPRPYVRMVQDKYSTSEELGSAAELLALYGLGEPN